MLLLEIFKKCYFRIVEIPHVFVSAIHIIKCSIYSQLHGSHYLSHKMLKCPDNNKKLIRNEFQRRLVNGQWSICTYGTIFFLIHYIALNS